MKPWAQAQAKTMTPFLPQENLKTPKALAHPVNHAKSPAPPRHLHQKPSFYLGTHPQQGAPYEMPHQLHQSPKSPQQLYQKPYFTWPPTHIGVHPTKCPINHTKALARSGNHTKSPVLPRHLHTLGRTLQNTPPTAPKPQFTRTPTPKGSGLSRHLHQSPVLSGHPHQSPNLPRHPYQSSGHSKVLARWRSGLTASEGSVGLGGSLEVASWRSL
ncbi:hypothetical protein L873DRAFT_1070764 [Choiromyces venosus 120613-1]|uniref:Uncharacterized protein n=1 Tax=Choiromyces venosus 120613-1 TaxID=1336337 RepID=A0A3N4K688_9PEZI|nr:hypothetical protein L873DRAFT_1070764 [Choiromyces venosus 120613-1]